MGKSTLEQKQKGTLISLKLQVNNYHDHGAFQDVPDISPKNYVGNMGESYFPAKL